MNIKIWISILAMLILTSVATALEEYEYTFVNDQNQEVNDLHIDYSESIDAPAPNPDISVATDFSRDNDKLTIRFINPLVKGGRVIVKAYSTKILDIDSYQWSITQVVNNQPVSQPIGIKTELVYQTTKATNEKFNIFYETDQPQRIIYKNSGNIKNVGAGQPFVTFSGNLTPGAKTGKFTAVMYYQNKIIELVVNIITESKDALSLTYIFKNIHDQNVNDLHIDYSATIDKSSEPEISVPTSNVRKNKDKLIIDLKNPLVPKDTVMVKVFSDKNTIAIDNYQWSLDGEMVKVNGKELKIPVKYILVVAKDGKFTASDEIEKPRSLVKSTYTNKINVKNIDEAKTDKIDYPGKTKLTYTGELANKKNPGQFIVIVDPPDEIYELVIDIIPEYTYALNGTTVTGGSTGGSKPKIILFVGMLLVITIIAINRKNH